VLEAYVNGVSTRKVDRLVEQLGIEGMTKDRVSAICRTLDEQVELFCSRPLEGAYPYLWQGGGYCRDLRTRGVRVPLPELDALLRSKPAGARVTDSVARP
jgi:transposase-like protein